MKAPLVSVVIPCYNQGHYGYESVLSTKSAYSGPLEIVIVNDGSTQARTERLLEEVAGSAYDERCTIKIVTQENRGLSGARNSGIDLATGDYLQLLDCDDILLPGKIDRQLAHFQFADSLDVSVTDCLFSNESVDHFSRYPHLMADSNFDLIDFAQKWERGFSLPIHCALLRRSVFDNRRFHETLRSKEDWLFWTGLVAEGARIAYLGGPGVVYRVHDESLCRASPDIGRQWLRSALEIDKIVRPAIPRFLDDAVEWYNKTYAGMALEMPPREGESHVETTGVKMALPARTTPSKRAARDPKFSIVIPVYEHFEFVERCLNSAAAQLDGDTEIVVVDDASSDPRIADLLKSFAREHGAAFVAHAQNKGVSATLNDGIAKARGDYVAFLDCDDVLATGALNEVRRALADDPRCDYLFSDRYDISETDEVLRIARYGGYGDDRFCGEFRVDLLNGMVASHLKVIRRSAILRAGGFDTRISGVQDWLLALKIAEFGRFKYLPEPLYGYRVHPNTVTNSDRRRQFMNTNVVRREFAGRYFRGARAAGRPAVEPKVLKPADLAIRRMGALWRETPLVLDLSVTPASSEIWKIREFNSYFDEIRWADPETHAALLGYVWSPDILRRVEK